MKICLRQIVLFLCIFAFSFIAQAEESCKDELAELFKSSSVAQEKLQEFLQLQAGITLHRIAYASVRSSGHPEEFRLERNILALLNRVKDKRKSDKDFAQVYELFHDSKNKVSRNALAKAMPYIADILNDQTKEQSAFERAHFNLGQDDLKMLAILAQRESFVDGQYSSALFRDQNRDESILNFTKIINSSIRTSGGPSDGMLHRMDKRLSELQSRAAKLLRDLDLSIACHEEVAACYMAGSNGRVVLDPKFSAFLIDVVNKAQLGDQFKGLRYDDVWLHTGKNSGSLKTEAAQVIKKKARKYIPPTRDASKIVHQYLVEKVLAKMPQLFTRQDLIEDRELALALARALDEGILDKKGKERVFAFKGERYYLPELINSETPDSGDGKLSWAWGNLVKASGKLDSVWSINKMRRMTQGLALDVLELGGMDFEEKYPDIKEEHLPDFLTTWNKQKYAFGGEFAFTFDGQLYDIETGKPIERGAKSFLSKYIVKSKAKDKEPSEPNEPNLFAYPPEQLEKIAREIERNNHSFIDHGVAKHISGSPVSLEQEYRLAKKDHHFSLEEVRKPFPSIEDIKSSIGKKTNSKAIVLKTLADRKKSYLFNDKGFELGGKEISLKEAEGVVERWRKVVDAPALKLTRGSNAKSRDNKRIIANAVAINNGDPVFDFSGKTYYSDTGASVSDKGTQDIEGFVSEDAKLEVIERLNRGTSAEVILDYHRRYPNPSCESIILLDKAASELREVKIKNGVAYTKWRREVLLGKSLGDEKTFFQGGLGGVTSNGQTAAGIFWPIRTEGAEMLSMSAQAGGDQVDALFGLANATDLNLLNDGGLENNRTTKGSVLLRASDLKELVAKIKSSEDSGRCPLYILPEEDHVRFIIKEDSLGLEVEKDSGKERYHISPTGEEGKRTPRAIKYVSKKGEALNDVSRGFLKALEVNKPRIMKDLGLSNQEYNEMGKIAFGVLGVESQFGDGLEIFPENSKLSNILNPRRHKEKPYGGAIVFLGKLITRGEFSLDPDSRSRGLTQIKAVENYPLVKKFGGINAENLMEADKAAVATMYVLGSMLNNLKSLEAGQDLINEKNRMSFLYYIYNGQTGKVANASATPDMNYRVRQVNEYANLLHVYSKRE